MCFLLQPKAGGGGALRSSVTEGAATERISITIALQALGADLREAFDGVAHRDAIADAGEESLDRERACGAVESLGVIPEAHPGALAGAGAYRHVEGCFVIDDQGFDVEPRLGVVCEEQQRLWAEHLGRHQRDAMPGRADALLHRVGREERAQDGPEQPHDLQCKSGIGPADLRRLYPTKFAA